VLPISPGAGRFRKIADRAIVRPSSVVGTLGDQPHGVSDLAWILRLVDMGKLAAGLAHEVSQPLAVVANLLEALAVRLRRQTPRPGETLDLVEQAISQSDRASRIIVHIARLLRGGERLQETCDIRDVVAGAADLVRPIMRQHGIMLDLVNDQAPCLGSVCRIEIEQVVVNLLQNAIDAVLLADHRRRRIILETIHMADQHLRVSVHDSGNGISPQLADRMFEPFFTTKADGLGMGLAISRSIVEEHGGCIWVDTQSAAVCFALPLHRSDHVRHREGAT